MGETANDSAPFIVINMNQQLPEDVPACFKTPTIIVGKSKYSIVVGYQKQGIIAKFDRLNKERVYSRLRGASTRIYRERQERQRMREELQPRSRSPDIVPEVWAVIHDGYSGQIAYTEVQEWFRSSRTLAVAGLSLFSASTDVLLDIRLIFTASLKFYGQNGDFYDTLGTVPEANPLQKIYWAVLPLFGSTNILIDRENNVRYVDATVLPGKKLPLRSRIHRILTKVGERISIIILDAVVFIRKADKRK